MNLIIVDWTEYEGLTDLTWTYRSVRDCLYVEYDPLPVNLLLNGDYMVIIVL